MDAAGYDVVIVETVGVGQDEVDVVRTADTVLVVLVPGMGDDIQAIKAGIIEIADIFVINKADQPGADRLQAELDTMMSLGAAAGRREIVRTSPSGRRGSPSSPPPFPAIGPRRNRAATGESGEAARASPGSSTCSGPGCWTRRSRAASRRVAVERIAEEIAARRVDPYAAVERVLRGITFSAGAARRS